MDSGHYIEKCKHGIVLSQCRCPGPRTEYIIECPAECDAMNLRAQLADRDAEVREAAGGSGVGGAEGRHGQSRRKPEAVCLVRCPSRS